MKSAIFAFLAISFALFAPLATLADCSEEEMTAVFIVNNISSYSTVLGEPGVDLPRDAESFWHVDTFNCANLDVSTPDNHAWWCGDLFTSCNQQDPPEGYGNSWHERLGWRAAVPDPSEPVIVTVRARLNLDCEVGYDSFFLQYIGAEYVHDVWERDGFAEGLIVEQTFTVQPEDFTDPFDEVHLRWSFKSDGSWSDEDCLFPTAGAAQIDLIEVFFDQGAGPVQMGGTETCEPGNDLQWSPEFDELHLELLDVAPLGPVTNPSMAEMIAALEAVQPGSGSGYHLQAQAGSFNLFFSEPSDFGGCGIVDGRDGRVVFAGTMVYLGFGSVTWPEESSHPWSFSQWKPATAPAGVEILPNFYWLEQHGTPNEITDAAVDYLRESDVLRSFGYCGAYEVVSYIYTPGVLGDADPAAASLVVIVSGHCGPPWADFPSAAPPVSSEFSLTRVYPNPFNPVTTISFHLQEKETISVGIYDLKGRLVKALVRAEGYAAGNHTISWQGKDDRSGDMPSGAYLVRIETDSKVVEKKVSLIK